MGERTGMSPEGAIAGLSTRIRFVVPSIPTELDGARVLKYAIVTPEVRPTGATRHYRGALLPCASALAVATYDSDPTENSYYLFYLDTEGQVMTDTWHQSVEQALAHAAFEYEGLSWQPVSE